MAFLKLRVSQYDISISHQPVLVCTTLRSIHLYTTSFFFFFSFLLYKLIPNLIISPSPSCVNPSPFLLPPLCPKEFGGV